MFLYCRYYLLLLSYNFGDMSCLIFVTMFCVSRTASVEKILKEDLLVMSCTHKASKYDSSHLLFNTVQAPTKY